MRKYGVLIVDDSAFMRRAISKLLEHDPRFFVVGVARNGLEAVEKAARLQPDLITMDVEMPEMDGIAALARIMETHPLPVVMLSSHTEEGATATLQALEHGAVDFFLKSELLRVPLREEDVQDFYARLCAAADANLPGGPATPPAPPPRPERPAQAQAPSSIDLVLIGCSTGGPSALQTILPRFSTEISVPILVVQHMPAGFTKPLADRFDSICNLRIVEAKDGDRLEPGLVHIAPAGFQTLLRRQRDGSVVLDVQEHSPIETLYRPSIDVTLSSAAHVYRERLLGVILTGMGSDGLEGCRRVKAQNGHVLVESEESCIVYGMPKVVHDAGLADRQCALSHMYSQIMQYLTRA